MDKKVQSIKWLYLTVFLLPVLGMAQEKETKIDEVVLVGYTKVSKKDVTNSVSSVKAEAIKDMPSTSAAEAIQGRMAGVQVSLSEGSPGADVDIVIRGGNSITGSNAPLYIVDGVQMDNALSILSPKEIESIEVLKDASSTNIYGARGANGVVMITTKGGRKRAKTSINYNGFLGVRKIQNTIDVLDPYQYVLYQYEVYNKGGVQTDIDAFKVRYGTYDQLSKYKDVQKRDWQDEVFGREAFNFTHNLAVTGGSDNSSFALSLNNVEEDGIMIGSGFKRSMLNFKYDYDISKKLNFTLNTRYSRQTIFGTGTSSTGSQSTNRLRNAVRYQPFEGGSNVNVDDFDPLFANETNLVNPILLANNEIKENGRNDLLLNGTLEYKISKDFTFRSVIGYLQRDEYINQFSGAITSVARQNNDQPVVVLNKSQTRRITNTNTLNYRKTFGSHKLDLLVGQEIVKTDGESLGMTIKWFPKSISAEEAFANIQSASPPGGLVQDAPKAGRNPDRLASFFGRANYIFKNKYILTASMRADGSSVFGAGNQWGYFPAASAAWKITEENFLKESQTISELKLRAGYGLSGNNRIGSFLYDTFFTTSSDYGYAFGTNVTPGATTGNILANKNVTWEKSASKNLGLDFGLFKGKVYGTLDVYQTDTKDLLLLAQIPKDRGYEYQYQNSGSTTNKGIEFSIGSTIINKENFTWKMDANISSNKNTIKSLGNNASPSSFSYLYPSGWQNSLNDFLVQVGKPVGTFWGYQTAGRYEVSDFDYNPATQIYTLKAGIPSSAAAANGAKLIQPGDLKLQDLNGDGIIDNKDMTDLGNAQPKFYGGFSQNFRYKNWDMSLMFNFSVGNKVYNANKIEYSTQYLYKDNNMLAEVADRFRWFNDAGEKVNDPTQLAALNANTTGWTPPAGAYFLHSYAIEDGSFLRLNNVTLGYSLGKEFTKQLGLSNFRLYFTMNNVFTITGYSGYDPEANTRRNPLTPGVDYAAYPRSRFILSGVDITF
ncbi:SusC/RagA family TonB-linked outer membrane protein [Chryseobacterium balustinum]|uniref:Outer membrane receptor for ferrienterochelin and colicins n=1 Tax=Chryseobacterium balustinum TaxID=246 RepID=A0AAX2IIW9_9FLAO|nr:TonB-dependent receptor [Chryseobacterium balustinum]AZB30775.1 TonB-dependent receptor [Chryseobacterium balustinum]SKC00178.1 TonB-linked outer membrane protein, SusC/RagA family [Chryseobacterium balustinum]SQA88786.1 Outer membrane receptor for ferrienterochelin and colicins [Chryseobacterium balustinum]